MTYNIKEIVDADPNRPQQITIIGPVSLSVRVRETMKPSLRGGVSATKINEAVGMLERGARTCRRLQYCVSACVMVGLSCKTVL